MRATRTPAPPVELRRANWAARIRPRPSTRHISGSAHLALATNAIVLGTAAAAGAAGTTLRSNDTIAAFDITVPVTQAYSDAAATGVAAVAARRDHKHGMPAAGGASGGTPALTLGTANTAGIAGTFIREDDTILAFDITAPSTQAFGDAAARWSGSGRHPQRPQTRDARQPRVLRPRTRSFSAQRQRQARPPP